MRVFMLRFRDGYRVTVLAYFDEMISMLDKMVQEHGHCEECIEELRYDRYTGSVCKKIW